MPAYRWNERSGRYADSRGRYVSDRAVRAVVDDIADAASERMARAAQALLDGNLSLGAFQAEMQATIRLAHVSTAVIAHGGAEQMTPSRYGALGTPIREQYQYLRGFADDIASGRQPLNGSLTARARQYGQASRVTFEKTYGQGQQARGYRFEANVLGAAEHCASCRAQTARGRVPIGTLVPVGQRSCRANCRCRLAYYRVAEGEQAA